IVVRSSLNTAEGTIVKSSTSIEEKVAVGVAGDDDAARIAVLGVKDEPGVAFKLFNLLARNNINVDIILQSVGRNGTKDISFTVAQDLANETVELIKNNFARSKYTDIDVEGKVAKVSIVGAGMVAHPGVAANMFRALYEAGINIRMISTSEIRVTVLVDEEDMEKAMNAAHKAFHLEAE